MKTAEEIFNNRSDCYTELWDNDNQVQKPAMTKETFVELIQSYAREMCEEKDKVFEDLLDTVKRNSEDNTTLIENVKLFCDSWKKEYEIFNPIDK